MEGDTATFADVLPGVDLTVRALPMGFTHNLVVRDRPAAGNAGLQRVRFGLTIKGGTPRVNDAGGIEVAEGGEEPWLTTPTPRMWDSPKPGAKGAEHAPRNAVMRPEVTANSLTLATDRDVLLGEQTVYPVVIDPTYKWTGNKRDGDWATVSTINKSASYWESSPLLKGSTYGDAGAGRFCDDNVNFTCYSTEYLMRSFFRMNTEYVTRNSARVVKDATFKITQKHAWVCQTQSPKSYAKVWHTERIRPSHTWNNQPGFHSETATSTEYANYSVGCDGAGTVYFPVGAAVKRADSGNWYSVTLALRAIDESTVAHWKRFGSGSAALTIEYNTIPGVPKYLDNGGKSCQPLDTRPWISTRSPQLSGRVYDADNDVKGHFRLYRYESGTGWTLFDTRTTGYVSSGTRVYWTSGKTLTDGSYYWKMKSYDGELSSAYTSNCHFRVDATPPSNLAIKRIGEGTLLAVGDSVQFQLSATDTNGITKFTYGLDSESAQKTVAASSNAATITWSNLTAGRHVLYVWAYDPAGNRSARGTYTLFVGTEHKATNFGAWRLDGDGIDDSGKSNPLTVPASAAWAPDRTDRADSALHVTGAADECAETSSPVISTDASYSVAAWVRLDELNRSQTVLAQAGTHRPAFYLQYGDDTWRLSLPTADDATTSWQGLSSGVSPVLGQWTHLAATVDAEAKIVRFYINGDLLAESAISYTPWNATGPLLVGCAGDASGGRWNELNGAIDHVGVWQGLLTAEEVKRSMTELPAAVTSEWLMQGSGQDTSAYERDLTVPTTAKWVDGEYGRHGHAVELDGQTGSCMKTSGSVIRTGESFSISAWVKLAKDASGNPTVISQSGTDWTGLGLRYNDANDRWLFAVLTKAGTAPMWASVSSSTAPVRDKWTHLVGVADVTSKQLRLYVDGEQDSKSALSTPAEYGAGSLLVGCESSAVDGNEWHHFKGALSDVTVFRGALTAEDITITNPGIKQEALWPLDGADPWLDPDAAEFTDTSGNGRHLTATGDYEWVDDRDGNWTGALKLGPGSCAETSQTADTVVQTDKSFTVMARVKLDPSSNHRIVVSQAGTHHFSFILMYHSGVDRWVFGVPSTDEESPQWLSALSTASPTPNEWTHLAGVYDLVANKLRLYVNGIEEGIVDGPASPWSLQNAPLMVGCVGTISGSRSGFLNGTVDDVKAWYSTVAPDRICDEARRVDASTCSA